MDEVVGRGHFPHSTTVGDFLRRFSEEEHFTALQRVEDELNRQTLRRMGCRQLTLDIDATIIEADSSKRENVAKAYNGAVGFQPLILFALEPGLVLAHDFRPANVHPGAGATGLIDHALTVIPAGVKLHFRSDSACYDQKVVNYCEDHGITFTIAAPLTERLRKTIDEAPESAWRPLDKGVEIAQVYYQPTGWSRSYRFIVTRRAKGQDLLGTVWKHWALVTNIKTGNPDWILQRHRRHANVENGIRELKGGFSLSRPPCLAYRANRAWFQLGLIANDLFSAIKLVFLPGRWASRRIKSFRWRMIQLGGLLVRHARKRVLKIARGHPRADDLVKLRRAVQACA